MQTINKILKKFRKPEMLKKIAVIFVQQNTNSWWSENASCCWLGRPGVSQQLPTIHFRYHIDLSCHWQIQSSWTCYRQVHSWYCLPTQRLRIQPQTQHGLCLYPGGAQIVQRNWRRMCHLQKLRGKYLGIAFGPLPPENFTIAPVFYVCQLDILDLVMFMFLVIQWTSGIKRFGVKILCLGICSSNQQMC